MTAKTDRKKALITGITGQDGSYLAELLAGKNYEVHGLVRWKAAGTESENLARATNNIGGENISLHIGDLTNPESLMRVIARVKPDEIYNLGALSHVDKSNELPEYAGNVNGVGCIRMLEAVRTLGMKKTRFYQASTSEMFGSSAWAGGRQNESTPFSPENPYGLAKLYAHHSAVYYRKAFGMHVSSGILFNHESPRRGKDFVTRKITMAAANISLGKQEKLLLGNMDAKRDWGHSADYVRGMWMIVQHDEPDDWVLATGKLRTVRELAEAVFRVVGIDLEWKGKGLNEKGLDRKTGREIVAVDKSFFRPLDKALLCGDASKAERILGWKPEISFEEMVGQMVRSDIELRSKQ